MTHMTHEEAVELRESLQGMFKTRMLIKPANTPFNQKFYQQVVSDIKAEHPEHYQKAVELANTATFQTNKGARTTHYIDFDFDKVVFTDNQATKIDNLYQGRIAFDPWIGRKPSKPEIIQYASWVISTISTEEGTKKTY